MGIENSENSMENSMAVTQLEIQITYESTISFLGIPRNIPKNGS
jgi:hypothetical protein